MTAPCTTARRSRTGDRAGEDTVRRVRGPVVTAGGLTVARLYDLVWVGPERLPGEVIRLDGDDTVVQMYEDTTGLRVGDPVVGTGRPLDVELGPGLLGAILDGTQRPLATLARVGDDPWGAPFMIRGIDLPVLDRERRWAVEPSVTDGAEVGPGDVLATVQETTAITHRILVPPGVYGTVAELRDGPLRVCEPLALVGGTPVPLLQRWPVRHPRPAARRLGLTTPLVSGTRVLDMLFPLARGGTATIPGGFGTGKTVLEQSLAKFADADVVVYVGCGERGNELTEVLQEFPELVDSRSGAPLMERTILVANTSNMPVAAREASIYTGITIAEYFRDQGYHVAMMADSTSRWGEALREVSSRLDEMPAEEGYPAYLATRLAEFYERAGTVRCLGTPAREGSVTVVGAVSPPGGDFSEPVTQHTLRLAGTFWALDTELSRSRHFPAVNWNRSYTLYDLDGWFDTEVAADWSAQRRWALDLLQQETSLLEIVQLLGADALAPAKRVVLRTGRLLREDFLQQSSFDELDAFCALGKQHAMLGIIRRAHSAMGAAVEDGTPVEMVTAVPALADVGRMKAWPADEAATRAEELAARIEQEVSSQ